MLTLELALLLALGLALLLAPGLVLLLALGLALLLVHRPCRRSAPAGAHAHNRDGAAADARAGLLLAIGLALLPALLSPRRSRSR